MLTKKSKAHTISNVRSSLLNKSAGASEHIYQSQAIEKSGRMLPPEIIQVLSDSSCPYIKCKSVNK